MSLLSQTARYLLLTALAIALVGSVVFYVLIHGTIQHEVDEILTSQIEQTKLRLQLVSPGTSSTTDWDDNPHIEYLTQSAHVQTGFSDTLLPDPLNTNKLVPVRHLRALFQPTVSRTLLP